ncbi:flagellar FliJ family protein [Burkholderia ubonensis]|uniref:flagellar FliJ family protein n=1 Tax=Burkholderia ubonensis TaxID=101571 RepID=UPI000755DDC9|nr:flagellar FliJ family protein [Burkholderia ubonensis]KWB79410.1 hypothetical protein WL42_12675 [Burkholderia ubonensis]
MSQERIVKSLGVMIAVKDSHVERLKAEVAAREQACRRYRDRIDTIEQLCRGAVGRVDRQSSAHVLNYAGYAQTVASIVGTHRRSLATQEADLAAARGRLVTLVLQRERWQQARSPRVAALARQRASREQMQQDEAAASVWLRSPR